MLFGGIKKMLTLHDTRWSQPLPSISWLRLRPASFVSLKDGLSKSAWHCAPYDQVYNEIIRKDWLPCPAQLVAGVRHMPGQGHGYARQVQSEIKNFDRTRKTLIKL